MPISLNEMKLSAKRHSFNDEEAKRANTLEDITCNSKCKFNKEH